MTATDPQQSETAGFTVPEAMDIVTDPDWKQQLVEEAQRRAAAENCAEQDDEARRTLAFSLAVDSIQRGVIAAGSSPAYVIAVAQHVHHYLATGELPPDSP